MINDEVVRLQPREAPKVQSDAIEMLRRSLGQASSRDVVERAVFEISDRMCKLEMSLYDRDVDAVGKLASGLIGLSSQIGLGVFAQVACSLNEAIQDKDAVATAALAHRLLRLAESSLYEAIEVAHQSG